MRFLPLSFSFTRLAMHGFAPEHSVQSAKAYMIYFGLPMVAKYDKATKEYVKASPEYIMKRFWEVIGSYAYVGTLYSIYIMFPNSFPQPGTYYTEHYFTLRYIVSNLSQRNVVFYGCKFSLVLLFVFRTSVSSSVASFLTPPPPSVMFEATLSTSGNGGNFVSTLLTGRPSDRKTSICLIPFV